MTNSSGQTENVVLEAPPKALSLSPGDARPYSEYQVAVSAPGYEPAVITGTEILADTTAIQNVRLHPLAGYDGEEKERITIPEHTLYADCQSYREGILSGVRVARGFPRPGSLSKRGSL